MLLTSIDFYFVFVWSIKVETTSRLRTGFVAVVVLNIDNAGGPGNAAWKHGNGYSILLERDNAM